MDVCVQEILCVLEYLGLMRIKGMGAQVKNTVTRRKDFLPHTSESAPMRGALMNDSKPWVETASITTSNQNYQLINNMLACTLYYNAFVALDLYNEFQCNKLYTKVQYHVDNGINSP